MTNSLVLTPRDRSLLRLLSYTPATTHLLQKASQTFEGGGFSDERCLRERLQALRRAGFLRRWLVSSAIGGLENYYKLTSSGFITLFGPDADLPPRTVFTEIAPAFFEHTLRLAEVIVHLLVSAHDRRVQVVRFFRENELTFASGSDHVQPDGFFRLRASDRPFNVALELDQSTESIESTAQNSIRQKLRVYDAYQESLLTAWRDGGRMWESPRFRVVLFDAQCSAGVPHPRTRSRSCGKPSPSSRVCCHARQPCLGSETLYSLRFFLTTMAIFIR